MAKFWWSKKRREEEAQKEREQEEARLREAELSQAENDGAEQSGFAQDASSVSECADETAEVRFGMSAAEKAADTGQAAVEETLTDAPMAAGESAAADNGRPTSASGIFSSLFVSDEGENVGEAGETTAASGHDAQADSAQETAEPNPPEPEEEPAARGGFFQRLKAGLSKTRDQIARSVDRVFSGYSSIDDDFYEELEETMIMSDIGVRATDAILTRLKEQVDEQNLREPEECRALLTENIRAQMHVDEHAYDFERGPSVVLVIGVNGVGKTTSVGKLAGIYKNRGKKVLIAAADTFRAAAGEQLAEWANRAGVDLIAGAEGSDPASVVYDAVCAAKARKADILLCDTAGRLHNKKNLMEELRKIDRIITREYPEAMRENLVVLDGATGQNALAQAREFGSVTALTGIILTKMDGTSKGGIAVAVQSELHIPVKFIGIGEQLDDLQRFEPDEYVDAILGKA